MFQKKLTLTDLPLLQKIGRASYEPYYPHLWLPGGMEWYMSIPEIALQLSGTKT